MKGTDLSDSNKRKSRAYARKQGLPEFEYVLQPRTKGFTRFVNTLRNGKLNLKEVSNLILLLCTHAQRACFLFPLEIKSILFVYNILLGVFLFHGVCWSNQAFSQQRAPYALTQSSAPA